MKVNKNLLFRCKKKEIVESVNFVETNLIKHVRIVIFTMQSDLYEGGLSMNILETREYKTCAIPRQNGCFMENTESLKATGA